MKEFPRLVYYGLDRVLSASDDPALWNMALQTYWPGPGDPTLIVDALRFGTGRILLDGDTPSGEANELTYSQRHMVDVEDWGFSINTEGNLTVESFHGIAPPPPVILPGISFIGPGMLQSSMTASSNSITVVRQYLTISRPSLHRSEAVVYYASSAPGVGEGIAYLWRKTTGGWNQSDTILSRWLI